MATLYYTLTQDLMTGCNSFCLVFIALEPSLLISTQWNVLKHRESLVQEHLSYEDTHLAKPKSACYETRYQNSLCKKETVLSIYQTSNLLNNYFAGICWNLGVLRYRILQKSMNTYYIQNYDQPPDYKNRIPKDITMNHRKNFTLVRKSFDWESKIKTNAIAAANMGKGLWKLRV